MSRFSISRAWDETMGVLRGDGRLILPVALAFLVLPGVIADTAMLRADSPAQPPGLDLLFMLIVLIAALVGQLAIIWLSISPKANVREAINRGARRAPAVIGSMFLIFIPAALILAPFVMPILASPTNPPPGASLALLIAIPLLLIPASRLSLASTTAVAEGLGPVAMLKRSWALTRGSTAKLYGMILLFLIATLALLAATRFVVGSLIIVALGRPEPWTVAALLTGLVVQLSTAILSVLVAIMIARIYAQLAGAEPVKGI